MNGRAIPFNRATVAMEDLAELTAAIDRGHTAGNGPATAEAEQLLGALHDGSATLLTTSCTHALELSARLIDAAPGDEIIVSRPMPSSRPLQHSCSRGCVRSSSTSTP